MDWLRKLAAEGIGTLLLLAVVIGGAGYTSGPLVGAALTVVLPEVISSMAEYRLLVFGGLLLVEIGRAHV